MSTSFIKILRDLRELIAALDRRTPQAHRVGEPAIARDSAALKTKAIQQIADIERTQRDAEPKTL